MEFYQAESQSNLRETNTMPPNKKRGFSISRSYYADHITERQTFGQILIEKLPNITFVIFLIATLFALRQQQQIAESHTRAEWASEVAQIESKINTQLLIYRTELYHFRKLSSFSETITCSFWKQYVNAVDIQSLYPGIKTLNFVPYVPQTNPNNLHTNNSRLSVCLDTEVLPDFLPTKEQLNKQTFFSKNNYSNEILYSYKTNINRKNIHLAVLVVLPIYPSQINNNRHQKPENLLGWVYATIDIQEIIDEVVHGSLNGTSLEIYDGEPENNNLLYKNEALQVNKTTSYQYRRRKTIVPQIIHKELSISNRIWTLKFIKNTNLEQDINQQEKLIVAISGLSLGLFLFCLAAVVVTTRKKALEMNEKLQEEISQRRKLQTALAKEKELAQVTLHSIGDGVITTDANGKIQSLNPVAENLTGWCNNDANNRPLMEVFNVINQTTKQPIENPITTVLKTGQIINLAKNTLLINRTGNTIPIEDSAAPIRRNNNQIIGAVLVFRDVTVLRQAQQQLSWQANHDTLTKLPNRRNFEKCLETALKTAKNPGTEHTLCYLDLDRFKQVNDTCGHAAGDEVLCQITTLIQSHIRKTDTLARLGGDEFALLLYECSIQDAMRVCHIILNEIQKYLFVWENQTLSLGVSIGLTVINNHTSEELTRVLCAADSACYAAKQSGRNCIRIYQGSGCHIPDFEANFDLQQALNMPSLNE